MLVLCLSLYSVYIAAHTLLYIHEYCKALVCARFFTPQLTFTEWNGWICRKHVYNRASITPFHSPLRWRMAHHSKIVQTHVSHKNRWKRYICSFSCWPGSFGLSTSSSSWFSFVVVVFFLSSLVYFLFIRWSMCLLRLCWQIVSRHRHHHNLL